jgi:hypothetical protein
MICNNNKKNGMNNNDTNNNKNDEDNDKDEKVFKHLLDNKNDSYNNICIYIWIQC